MAKHTHTYKEWKADEYYNFYVEFNRIEGYNEYCKQWLKYFNIEIENFTSKTDWSINDIVDIKDFNGVKNNINIILNTINSNLPSLNISTQYNQEFTNVEATEIDMKLKNYLKQLGEWQFTYNLCGLTTCGTNGLKLGGVK